MAYDLARPSLLRVITQFVPYVRHERLYFLTAYNCFQALLLYATEGPTSYHHIVARLVARENYNVFECLVYEKDEYVGDY